VPCVTSGAVPHGHWKTTTFTGALRVDGMTAPIVLETPAEIGGQRVRGGMPPGHVATSSNNQHEGTRLYR
jgi:hypothetical protein